MTELRNDGTTLEFFLSRSADCRTELRLVRQRPCVEQTATELTESHQVDGQVDRCLANQLSTL